MKTTFHCIAAAAMLATLGSAKAAIETITTGGESGNSHLILTGMTTLSLSYDMMAFVDSGRMVIAPYDVAVPDIAKDSDNYYVKASMSSPMRSVTIDSVSNKIWGTYNLGGPAFYNTQAVRTFNTAYGWLTVADLRVDFANKLVYGTVAGTGMAPKEDSLWTIGSITGATSLNGEGVYTTTLSNLQLTDTGLADFTQGLGLQKLGWETLRAVSNSNFGTITSTITALTPIPEPSTYVLMGLGLVGISVLRRRHKPA